MSGRKNKKIRRLAEHMKRIDKRSIHALKRAYKKGELPI